MASLLALMNRAITYLKESKSATGGMGGTSEVNSETSGTGEASGTNSEVSNDVDCGSSNKIASSTANNNRIGRECIVCDRVFQPRFYIKEEQMCQCCHEISLGKDKQCDSCGEVKHITLFRKPQLLHCEQCVRATLADWGNTVIHINVLYNVVLGICTF
jgi:hypothetical protein